MSWTQSWRRQIALLFILMAIATAAITLAEIFWTRDMDLTSLRNRAVELQKFMAKRPAPQTESELSRQLHSWAEERGLQVACLAVDGSLIAQSHPERSLAPLLNSVEVSTLTPGRIVVIMNNAATGNNSTAVVVQPWSGSALETPSRDPHNQIAFIGVGSRSRGRVGLRQLLPIWWMAMASFLVVATLWWTTERRNAEAKRRFVEASRKLSAGQFQDPPASVTHDPDWRDLSHSFFLMESNLAQREQLVEEERLRVQAVLSSMVEGVIGIDANLRIMVTNESAMTMLSLHPDFVIGRYAGEVVRNPSFEIAIDKARTTGQTVETEFETVGPRRRALSIRVAPLSPNHQAELAVVLYDVTDLRRLETMRRDFVANVSHELKTPLAAIKAYAETLRLGALDDKENNRHFLEQIEIHVDLLDRQVRDLMHLARVESGRAAFELCAVDLDQASAECVGRFREEALRREVRLSVVNSNEPIMAIADREAISTILDNLVSNAVRYTRLGGWIRVSAAYVNANAIITVADNGIGIAPEHQSRVFERFYRVDKARSRDVGGTGLGLAIVKHTVQALGGQIELTSSIGRGSTFQLVLHKA